MTLGAPLRLHANLGLLIWYAFQPVGFAKVSYAVYPWDTQTSFIHVPTLKMRSSLFSLKQTQPFWLALILVLATSCANEPDSEPADVFGPALEFAEANDVGMSQEVLDRIGPAMQPFLDDGRVSSMLTVVAKKGKIVHWEAQGMRDISAGDSLGRDDIFRIYSMSKPITSTAIMMLVEEGQIDLDAPVSAYIPSFADVKVMEEDGSLVEMINPVTIRHLLSHTGGLTYGVFGNTKVDSLYRASNLLGAKNLEGFAQAVSELPLLTQPGTVWTYSVSTDVLGQVVASVSGQTFPDFLSERVFIPLGMDDTGFVLPVGKKNRLITAYRSTESGLVDANPDQESEGGLRVAPFPSGGGGLYSTASDYLRFTQMILNEGELDGTRILRAETVQEMEKDQLPSGAPLISAAANHPDSYGFGLGFAVLLKADTTPEADHNGLIRWSGLYKTYFWIDPEEELIGMVWTQLDPSTSPDFVSPFQGLVYEAIQ